MAEEKNEETLELHGTDIANSILEYARKKFLTSFAYTYKDEEEREQNGRIETKE